MVPDTEDERARSAFADQLDVGVRPVTRPLVPARGFLVVMVVVMALVAMPAVLGRRIGTTPQFGPARSGLIVWAIDGDIVVGDPVAGTTAPLIGGPGVDRNPRYSRDGSRLAFLRRVPTDEDRYDLFVSAADGTGLIMISTVPMAMPTALEWTPDGNALLVDDPDGRLFRYSIYGSPRRLLVDGVHLDTDASRPPDGADILYERVTEPGALYLLSRDGSRAREIVGPTSETCSCTVAGSARWSPDGRMVAFSMRLSNAEARIYLVGGDGTGLRRLTDEAGPSTELDPTWSPTGDRIAFNRWQDEPGDRHVRPIGVVAATGGPVESIGVAPAEGGALIEWSPDGRSILSLPKTLIDAYASYPDATGSVARPVFIDVADGSSRQLDWSVGSVASWQRRAP